MLMCVYLTAQGIFNTLDRAGQLVEQTIEQLYSEAAGKFLADRFVTGTCPKCQYEVCLHCSPDMYCPLDQLGALLSQSAHVLILSCMLCLPMLSVGLTELKIFLGKYWSNEAVCLLDIILLAVYKEILDPLVFASCICKSFLHDVPSSSPSCNHC